MLATLADSDGKLQVASGKWQISELRWHYKCEVRNEAVADLSFFIDEFNCSEAYPSFLLAKRRGDRP